MGLSPLVSNQVNNNSRPPLSSKPLPILNGS